jgi:Acyl-CoA reductase (LuxC)
MAQYHVPLIIRGRIIDHADVEFGGRRGGASFATPDVKKHADAIPLGTPSSLSDLYELNFDDILDYLGKLHQRMAFGRNPYLQEAFELARNTSGLTEPLLRRTYQTMRDCFEPNFAREFADSSIGIPYLEGWVPKRMGNGAMASIRAIGARAVHVVAGNSPLVSSMTVMRNAVLRSDAIIKTPSNDPLTAAACARTMIDMAPDHPITKHLSVGYWKGGDSSFEDVLYQPKNIEKIIAWGGFASITHIAKYIQPGIDLITLDPKLSSSIIGKAAFQDERTMADAAQRMAIDIGSNNQEACLNARVAYIESGTDEDGLAKANRFGEMVYAALQSLPPALSTPVRRVDPQLAEEIHSLKMMSDDHHVIGGGNNGAVIVSQTSEPVDFARILTNRVANLVPVDDLEIPVRSVTAYTQTIGIYPDELKAKLRDRLAFHGAQRLVSLGYAARMSYAGPHDGIEPLRRMCKWIIEEEYDPAETPLPSKSYAEFAFADA